MVSEVMKKRGVGRGLEGGAEKEDTEEGVMEERVAVDEREEAGRAKADEE